VPEVSVVTTVYNCEDYIVDSMESMLSQTFGDFEWLILNDGSTDSTWDIVNSFDDSRIKAIDSSENWKIPRRRNQAIRMATGKYICIHDGDDISLPHRLQYQVAHLRQNSHLFCCGGWAISIDADGEQQDMMKYPAIKHEAIVNQLLIKKMNPMIDPTTLFHREGFEKLGGYTLDKSIYTVPDMDLWGRAILDGMRFENIPTPLIKYRRNPSGMTQLNKPEMIGAHMAVWKRFRNAYIEKMPQRTIGVIDE